jgi:hypothetical protein
MSEEGIHQTHNVNKVALFTLQRYIYCVFWNKTKYFIIEQAVNNEILIN